MSEQNSDTIKKTGIAVVSSLLNNKAVVTKDKIKELLINGQGNPTYVGVILKKFAKVSEEVSKDKELKELIEDDTRKYQDGNSKTFEVYGAKITIASGGFWDYSTTEDPLLEKLKEIESEVKAQIKAREEELQAKAIAWEKRNTPIGGQSFGISSFAVTFEAMPKLVWEEAIGQVETNPPIKRGKDVFRYTV